MYRGESEIKAYSSFFRNISRRIRNAFRKENL